jgi:UTP--glucose-1-phosphate uridylyltransferase
MLKLASEQKFYGFHYRGRTFDCGSPEGFVEANVAFALSRPDMRNKIADMIEGLVADFGPERRRSAS